jgi:peroxiredoxin
MGGFTVRMVLAALASVVSACAMMESRGADAPAEKSGLIGNLAPEFSVHPVKNGSGTVTLKGLRGKVVLVDFWGTFCDPCKESFPELQALHAKYASSGLTVIGISEDDAEYKGRIPSFADAYGAKFTLGWDEDRSIAHAYGPLGKMPSSFIIDQKGLLRFAHVGHDKGYAAQVDKEIQELLAQ